jgi:GGDEF domain-containing protein
LTFDSDNAGVMAALRAIPMLKASGLNVKVIDMKPHKDPDEFIKALGSEEYQKRIDNARNSFLYQIDKMKDSIDMSMPESKAKFYNDVAKKLLEFENKDTIIASMFRGSYIIAIHHLDSLETLRERCEKLHQALQLPELFGEKITASIGAAISDNELDRGYRGAANLAFKALDEAGAKGNSVCIYHDHQADIS